MNLNKIQLEFCLARSLATMDNGHRRRISSKPLGFEIWNCVCLEAAAVFLLLEGCELSNDFEQTMMSGYRQNANSMEHFSHSSPRIGSLDAQHANTRPKSSIGKHFKHCKKPIGKNNSQFIGLHKVRKVETGRLLKFVHCSWSASGERFVRHNNITRTITQRKNDKWQIFGYDSRSYDEWLPSEAGATKYINISGRRWSVLVLRGWCADWDVLRCTLSRDACMLIGRWMWFAAWSNAFSFYCFCRLSFFCDSFSLVLASDWPLFLWTFKMRYTLPVLPLPVRRTANGSFLALFQDNPLHFYISNAINWIHCITKAQNSHSVSNSTAQTV